ncbi:MAG: hypothetical protein GYB67_04425 [Chloroflexi bacterium]|nr:hypothetical protein [Chloroflexota bacterium]
MTLRQDLDNALNAGQGILHMVPCWVPRAFAVPGRRLRLAEDDLYALGADRGGLDERWLCSTTSPANGPDMPTDEGLSYVAGPDGARFMLRDAVEEAGASIIGAPMLEKYGRWPTLGKLFDNQGPLPYHLHPNAEHAALVNEVHKPEAYYFPPQYNPRLNDFPFTFFGLEPGTTKEDIRRALENWNKGDNGILQYSKAYVFPIGEGWFTPPGVLHAPGSLVTYEVQWGTDTFAMFQSVVEGKVVPFDMLVKDVPTEKKQDLDFVMELIDWEANILPNIKETYHLPGKVDNTGDGYSDKWVIYGKSLGEDVFSAKELTVQPGVSVTITDPGACGVFATQGRGTVGVHPVETPTFIRFGDVTLDEYFVTDETARGGYTVTNNGTEPLVLLRHFGPDCQPA